MKRLSVILSLLLFVIGISIPKYAIGQYEKLSKLEQLEKLKALKSKNDSLIEQLNNRIAELDSIKEKTQSQKYSPEIDEMLNIEDTTIFNVGFKQFDPASVHPRSREMYQWISNIHGLGEILIQIKEEHLSIENLNDIITNPNLPATTKSASLEQLPLLNTSIKENIRTADKLREKIELSYNEMKKTFSISQMDYYNGLVDKLNNYINLYFE